MPKKTNSQQIGDEGMSSVMALCTEGGWSVDFVRSDYGEDLVCQTFFKEEADPFRILVQVKSSQKLKTLQIRIDHARKWIASVDLVIIVFWEISSKSAYYCMPSDIWHLGEIPFLRQKFLTIRRTQWHPFTREKITGIEWVSRFSGLNFLLLSTLSNTEMLQVDKEASGEDLQHLRKARLYLAVRFLEYLGLAARSPDGVLLEVDKFLEITRGIKDDIGNEEQNIKKNKTPLDASIIFMILWIALKFAPGVSVPHTLLYEGMLTFKILLKSHLGDQFTDRQLANAFFS